MFPKYTTGAVESYGIDATVKEWEAEPNNTEAMPPGVVVVLGCRTEKILVMEAVLKLK